MTQRRITFRVPGIPAPGGSKKAFIPKGWSRAVLTDAGGKKTKDWRSAVALAAYEAMQQEGDGLLGGPLSETITFYLPRPKWHFNSKGQLKDGAPKWVIVRPDSGKLLRSTEDAMTGVVYDDDSQIARTIVERRYGEIPGAEITIETIPT
jgi:Holliday junction resolvase RusA-like endonuclease